MLIMFGPRLNTVFASRWRAVWFAVTILLTAYCSVPDEGEQPLGLGLAASAAPVAEPHHAKSPSALDEPQRK